MIDRFVRCHPDPLGGNVSVPHLGIRVAIHSQPDRHVKFKDADLIGIPLRVVIGRSINEGFVEVKERHSEIQKISLENVGEFIYNFVTK